MTFGIRKQDEAGLPGKLRGEPWWLPVWAKVHPPPNEQSMVGAVEEKMRGVQEQIFA